MTKLIAAAAGLAVVGTAMAQNPTFSAAVVSTGSVPGVGNDPAAIAVAGGTFYHDAFDTNFLAPPNGNFIPVAPTLALDTYLNIDLEGPISATNGTDGLLTLGDGVSSENPTLTGGLSSSVTSRGVGERWHVARLTVLGSDAAPTGEMLIGVVGGGDVAGNAEVQLNLDGTVASGQLPFGVFLDVVDVTADVDAGALATVGASKVWDVYVQSVPTPGAAGLLGLAGLAAIRRRR